MDSPLMWLSKHKWFSAPSSTRLGNPEEYRRKLEESLTLDAEGKPFRMFGQPIKVNWAHASGQREDTSGHYNIFVGDLSPEVTDATLFACFSAIKAARKWLGSRQIRCNWATKGAEDDQETANDDGPDNNPQYTTVYVGNLAPEASI
ncbi:hypothetical protein J5N97_001549 [Dioscorea zingiberensis]|uniref:Uncharacterized protein n=1 Tax=Dioscorea zingiberensis TaxID=325984 RepID=A0A9D5H352_9LILI|nr:hypothetical protein J5N97_001549 [Dioscorea zingiberensis]